MNEYELLVDGNGQYVNLEEVMELLLTEGHSIQSAWAWLQRFIVKWTDEGEEVYMLFWC